MLLDHTPEIMRSDTADRRRNAPAARDASDSWLPPFTLIALLYTLSLLVFYGHGLIHASTFFSVVLTVSCMITLFHGMFRFGLNRRFNEASLMLPQLLAILATMLAVAWLEHATQIALAPFILVTLSLGVFRLSAAALVTLAIGCLGIYLGMIVMRDSHEGFTPAFRSDLIEWMVLALTVPGVIAVGKQIHHLRQALHATQHRLEHYEEKSIRDELTGLYNRRWLLAELERLQVGKDGQPFSICLIDIDHFKEINDTNGHLTGDRILAGFAHVARECIRDSDIFGRYGGDEFLQILPHTDLKGAVMHAERLRVYAHFLDFEDILAQKHISLSIGVAQYQPGETLTSLIARADSALYMAKQLGRNRVEWLDEC
jgi:diguanylate cyclase (GGDEF)-like protein